MQMLLNSRERKECVSVMNATMGPLENAVFLFLCFIKLGF